VFGFGLVTLIFAYALVENVIEKPDGIVISAMFIAGMLLISLVSRLSRAAAHAEIILTSSFWASAASVRCLDSSFCCWATRVALTLSTACRNWRNPSAEASGTLE
jgi:hypothetical protein